MIFKLQSNSEAEDRLSGSDIRLRPIAVDRFLRAGVWASDTADLGSKGDSEGSINL
jgi:hypothetical protein